ncbi:MarR family transcriptional regulator [Neoasaia chiangmaiensis NBRC 101099]|uniref:Uncharacterized protein n=1 Tax=Neoasaia chiangmaiensis TaxID=320497 RepID=A0A1U9KNE0_9PROT|nr:MarR family transcriptional regulator [Neoasaia chiangmaiensis]AQS87288.1 hypothetical protein A0U93_04315 [Neoasaia chiangmaiensis]GBR38573.1 MarR family transcriptional regulator [Neoasaia chiangmaiensis NBRC 101099]GEN15837.1 MarR family transcriptional regulator [Neoasaia chiangmaiensis]
MNGGASGRAGDVAGSAHLFLREEQLRLGYESMLRVGRELARVCDDILQRENLGPAHQRVLFLIATHPGMTMTRILQMLHITKQSLNRVLQELVAREFVERRGKTEDRRLKLLFLTEKGRLLEAAMFDLQRERLIQAYRGAGGTAVEGFRRVLGQLMSDLDAA